MKAVVMDLLRQYLKVEIQFQNGEKWPVFSFKDVNVPHVCMWHKLSGLVVRVFTLRLGGRGSIPGRFIPKT